PEAQYTQTNKSNNIIDKKENSDNKSKDSLVLGFYNTITSKITDLYNKANAYTHSINKTKEEDFYCNELTNNSVIEEIRKYWNISNQHNGNFNDTFYCSKSEIQNIAKYSNNYPFVINIMNENLDNSLLNLTQNFKLISDYFKWFIIFAFIGGPIAFFLWMRNYIE
ncbi:MAG TPA: hypothetical protein VJ697_16530, partial [Nitrososphaeraceae archaeon]|nr:hypothetical protein [Nitrososphaeraceae archaeon]